MPSAVRRQLEIYGATIADPRWEMARPEVLCLVRRLRPKTDTSCANLLGAGRGLLMAVWDDRGTTSLTEALTTVNIEQYLRTLNAKNAANRRPLLLRLMAVATGIPLPASRRHSTRKQHNLSQADALWMQRAESGAPVIEVLANGCTADTLRAISPRLPAGDLASFREVLRG